MKYRTRSVSRRFGEFKKRSGTVSATRGKSNQLVQPGILVAFRTRNALIKDAGKGQEMSAVGSRMKPTRTGRVVSVRLSARHISDTERVFFFFLGGEPIILSICHQFGCNEHGNMFMLPT